MAAAFDYDLPEAAIAQQPVEPRDAARLLVDRGPDTSPEHLQVRDLPSLVRPGDVVVVNTSRVLRARLSLRKPTGGAVEVLVLERGSDGWWHALVRPSRRVPPGAVLDLAAGVQVEIGPRDPAAPDQRLVRFVGAAGEEAEHALLERHGAIPLPPYIHSALADAERYQTTYADRPGSVAAPTAGLHLTRELLASCEAAGAVVAPVDLRVGVGTFQPITAARVEDHVMHTERYEVPRATLDACDRAARVIAVGTTSLRALESARRTGQLAGETCLFLRPGDPPSAADLLLTNFHLPRSSLLALLEAFVGPRWRTLYDVALAAGYRFLSFGDAMLVGRAP